MIEDWLERKAGLHLRGLGRRGQDDRLGRDRARHGRARARRSRCSRSTPRGGSPTRSACPSSGNEERRVEVDVRRRAVGDDARRQAHLRRADRVARAGRAHARRGALEPHLPGALERGRGLAGVHGDGEAATSSTRRAATTCSCSTRRPPATRSTSSTPRASCRRSSTRARCSFFTRAGAASGSRCSAAARGWSFSVMKRATGIDLLEDLADFFRSFGGHGRRVPRARRARERAARRDRRTRVRAGHLAAARRDRGGAPTSTAACEDAGLPFAGVVANRVQQAGGGHDRAASSSELVRRRAGRARSAEQLRGRRAGWPSATGATSTELRRRLGRTPLIEVPAPARRRPRPRRACGGWTRTCSTREPAAQTGAE